MSEQRGRALVVGLNYSPEPTGIAPYTAGLVDFLVADGWSVQVITSLPHYPAWKVDPAGPTPGTSMVGQHTRITRTNPRVPAHLNRSNRVRFEVSFGLRALFTRWLQPDLIVLVSPALFSSAIAMAKARVLAPRAKRIVWVQDFYSLGVTETGTGGSVAARLLNTLESSVLRGAHTVIAIHDRFARYAVASLGVAENKVRVLRNWTHIPQVPAERQAARVALGWSDKRVVLHAGNMGAKQGLENVIDAARLADQESADIVFVLLGGGNRRNALASAASGVSRIELVNPMDDDNFRLALCAADVLLVNELPGVAEMAVPSKLTSYFTSGRPVLVASDEGSITSEEIALSQGGLRVDAGDPRALLDAALALVSDPQRADSLGASGRAFQQSTLSLFAAAASVQSIVRDLTAAAPGSD